jgi:conjugal transfer ATP-binding protein TraC
MSAPSQPFVSLKSWLTREDDLGRHPRWRTRTITTRQTTTASLISCHDRYWETEKLFAIEGEAEGSIEAIGYAIEMNPQTGATDDMARLIQEIYRDMPAGAGVQVQLWGSPDIDAFLNNFKKMVRPELLQDDAQRSLIARMTAERSAHYRKASLVPPVSSRPSVMRRYRVLLSRCR